MSSHNGQRPADVEALLRDHLSRRAGAIDPLPLAARIRETLGARSRPAVPPARSRGRRRLLRRLGWMSAVAAALVLALQVGLRVGPARASPEALLREAREVHQLPLERCYLVETRAPAGGLLEQHPIFGSPRAVRVWTRGDRFWVEVRRGERRHAWGRDVTGAFWMTLGPRRGIRIDPDETAPPLKAVCDLYSMQLDTLLNEVLRDFDLVFAEPAAGTETPVHVIRARLRPDCWHPSLRGAVLVVDAETKVLRRVALRRAVRGWPPALVTFTLAESRLPDEARYQPEGHLMPPFQVFDGANGPGRRRLLLTHMLGPRAARWMLEEKPDPPPAREGEKP